MNTKYFFGYAIGALFLLSGCSDELDNVGGANHAGDVIRFSASTEASGSRTSYGELTNGEYPVYWENGDNVIVYSPQAMAENASQTATYTVSVADEINSHEYNLTGTNTMKWGETDEHHFYTFYPADKVSACTENGVITATLPSEQIIEFESTTADGVTTWSPKGYDYMKNALMAGHLVQSRDASDGTVVLPFKPITTAIDIEIKAPQDVDASADLLVSSVTIANPADEPTGRAYLAGTFTYDISTPSVSENGSWVQGTDITDGSYIVNVLFKEPIVLKKGSDTTIKFTAFLLPKPGGIEATTKKLRIMVNCREVTTNSDDSYTATGATTVKTANITGIQGRKKNVVKMGYIPSPIVFSYETWMASLPDATYVSQISLPGTHDAGAFNTGSLLEALASTQTQVYSIPEQLNLGIRVLDFRPKYENGAFNVAHGLITLTDENGQDLKFSLIINDAIAWLAEHPTETIILILKNEFGSDSDSQLGWKQNILATLNKLKDTWGTQYFITDFNPSMTLKDARGKIIVWSRDHYYANSATTSDEIEPDGTGTHWFGCKISGWPDNIDQMIKSFYTPSYPKANGGIGKLTIWDRYRHNEGLYEDAYVPLQADKETSISTNIQNAYSDLSNDSWYITFLNVNGGLTYRWFSYLGPSIRTGEYNSYAANIIKGLSESTYQKSGIVMFDWAGYSTYSGDVILEAVVDNNFKAGGPAKAE